MTLGYIAAFSETLALAVVVSSPAPLAAPRPRAWAQEEGASRSHGFGARDVEDSWA